MRLTLIALGLLFIMTACAGNPPSDIAYADLPEAGDTVSGAQIYEARGCAACHMEGATGAPHLDGLGERADITVEGENAREYVFYSVVEPARHIVEGYGNAMPNNYDSIMTPQEIADLVAYLLDL